MIGPFKRLRASEPSPDQPDAGLPVPRWARPLAIPECPPGWSTAPPDFVGVGTQRAGTSWWYRFALEAHPQVARAEDQLKELHFFDRYWTEQVPGDLAERYAAMFPRPAGAIAGEWTPRYMHDPWTPPLLKRVAPDAKLLVMLRDPLERYVSGIARELRLAEREGRGLAPAYVSDQVSRSLYHGSLRHLFTHFERGRVLVLQYERCAVDPVGEALRTCSFLGIDTPDVQPPELTTRRRPPASKPELTAHMRDVLGGWFADDARATLELCGLDPALWPTVANAG